MIFLCGRSKEETIAALRKPEHGDNIKYELEETPEGYCFSVLRIPYQIGKRRPVRYGLVFVTGSEGLYIQVEAMEPGHVFRTSSYEPELYRFFIEKCDCAPAAKIV